MEISKTRKISTTRLRERLKYWQAAFSRACVNREELRLDGFQRFTLLIYEDFKIHAKGKIMMPDEKSQEKSRQRA